MLDSMLQLLLAWLFNENSFSAWATIITGFVAWYVFLRQQRNRRIQAARVILMEVRRAENSIDEILKISSRTEVLASDFRDISLMPHNAWEEYSHMFARLLSGDEMDLVNDFYSRCELIEGSLRRADDYVSTQVEEKSREFQRQIVIYAANNVNNEKLNDFSGELRVLINGVGQMFEPNDPVLSMKVPLQTFQRVLTSSAGEKLRKIAQID